ERASALEPHIVREIAELRKVVTLARVENDPNRDTPTFGGVQRVDDDRIRQGVGGEVDRLLCFAHDLHVDRVETFLGAEMNLLPEWRRDAEQHYQQIRECRPVR